jgi:hypothetical protein
MSGAIYILEKEDSLSEKLFRRDRLEKLDQILSIQKYKAEWLAVIYKNSKKLVV